MTCRIPTYDCIFLLGIVDVNVKSVKGEHCMCTWVESSVYKNYSTGVAHPIRDNILGAGDVPVVALIRDCKGEESRHVAFIITFVIVL